jgi:hypothetical protein
MQRDGRAECIVTELHSETLSTSNAHPLILSLLFAAIVQLEKLANVEFPDFRLHEATEGSRSHLESRLCQDI